MRTTYSAINNRHRGDEIRVLEVFILLDLRGAFCNKLQDQAKKVIAGPRGVFICDECVKICDEILEEELGSESQ